MSLPSLSVIANVAVSGALTGTIYGLMALGLSAIFGVMRLVNFAHGELMTLAMYAAALGFERYALDPFVCMPLAVVVLGGLAYLLHRGLIARFERRSTEARMLLMLALGTIIGNLLLLSFGPEARSVQPAYALDSLAWGPLLVDKSRIYAVLAALAATGGLVAFFRWTIMGKAVRACADNPLGARVAGLPVAHLYATTFAIGTACVAVAGCAMSTLVDVTPSSGPAFTLLGFVIVIVGGLGSMVGALLGGLLIGVSEALAGVLFAPSAKTMVSFGLLIVVLLVRPHGLMGKAQA